MKQSRRFTTDQEDFWAGEFGTQYIERNNGESLLASNLALFSKALGKCSKINSCMEFGANIGMNLKALKLLYPDIDTYGVEINPDAAYQLSKEIILNNVYNCSIAEFSPMRQWDLILIKGVLIHLNPESLIDTYNKIVQSTSRYILIAEYYNPTPMSIPYRGNQNRLFKRDFAGEILDRYKNIHLLDYGFIYHRDINFPQDDITWFLLEKSNRLDRYEYKIL